ncbi:MAG TPA: outer membrane beta-barrel protein [Gemmatimonadaceae bacterium]
MAVFAALVAVAQTASAQARPAATSGTGFSLGYTDIGPAIGLGGINGASASFGGRFEHAIKTLPDLGNGILGIEASFDYYSWGDNFPGYSWSYKYIPIGVTANYHFQLDDKKIDPFLGVGLGYNIVTCSSEGIGFGSCGYSSGIYPITRAGIRYFFQPRMAGYADAGLGGAALNVGLMFKLSK